LWTQNESNSLVIIIDLSTARPIWRLDFFSLKKEEKEDNKYIVKKSDIHIFFFDQMYT